MYENEDDYKRNYFSVDHLINLIAHLECMKIIKKMLSTNFINRNVDVNASWNFRSQKIRNLSPVHISIRN